MDRLHKIKTLCALILTMCLILSGVSADAIL